MIKLIACGCLLGVLAAAQEPAPPSQSLVPKTGAFADRPTTVPENAPYVVAPGTHILLNMINSVSTKQAAMGDRIYLETAFPVLVSGKIVVPQGSWVTGTVTSVKRPGRVKGRGELQVRFDSLVLPNGIARNFNGDLAAIDARDEQKLNRENSKITGPGDKSGDAGTVIGATTAGTVIGSGVGAAAGNVARGAGVGVGAGAAVGLLGVLLTRGPDATLTKGSTVEMVLDRPLNFSDVELDFRSAPPHGQMSQGDRPAPVKRGWGSRLPI